MDDRTLLVIDDSATIRKLVELSFATTRWRLSFATSGREGIDAALRGPVHAVLLDYVLPDMRGTDVCRALAENPAMQGVPILVMSAKSDGARSQFAGFGAVADFVAKPFSATDIVVRVNRACERHAPAEPVEKAKSPDLDFTRKQAIAQAIYQKLRPQLARIPEWVGELGGQAPAAFFSKKLLTVAFIDELHEIFAKLLLGEQSSRARLPDIADADFRGELGGFPLTTLLELFASSSATGLLELRCPEQRVFVYVEAGSLVHVSSDCPELYLRGATGLPALRAELRTAAEEEQRKTGRPALLAWAEAGALRQDDLRQLLAEQGRRLLVAVSRGHSTEFGWIKYRQAAPNVMGPAAPISLPSLQLEKLRQETAWSDVERSPAWNNALFERAPSFSGKLRELALTDSEREVLSLIDGRRDAHAVIGATKLPPKLAAAILYRLLTVDLIRLRPTVPKQDAPSPILVADPDETHFVRPLTELLAAAAPSTKVVRLPAGSSVGAAIQRESARLVLINASVDMPCAVRAAQELRENPALRGARLVALLDAPATDVALRLETLGYDAVLTKPLLGSELEGLIAR